MSEPFKLYRLQLIDTRLDKGLTRIAEIDATLADDTEQRSAEAIMNAAENAFDSAKKELKRAEETVRTQEEKISQNQEKLYGGTISNPKELEDLQNEADALKRYLGTLEDIQLEKMIEYETAQTANTKASEALSLLKEKISKQEKKLNTEKSELQMEVDRLAGEREAALSGIPDDDKKLYEKLRQKKAGLAVTGVADSSCLACGSLLPQALAQAARSPNKISLCDTCGRILHSG